MKEWVEVGLHEICRPRQWPTIAQTEMSDAGFPVYGANGKIGFYGNYNHEEETVLITCRGATCGRVNVCERKSYVTGNAMALDDLETSRVDLRYLVHALTPEVLRKTITGTAQPQITGQSLRAAKIRLPPLPEQRRIAAVLDHADALRTKRRQVLGHLDSLIESVFYDMFGDPVENPKRWKLRTLGEEAKTMQYGPRFYNEPYTDSGIRIVRITDLHSSGRLDFEAMPRMAVSEDDRSKYGLTPGDIIFARTGATVGKLAVIQERDPRCIAGAYFIRIGLKDDVLAEYVASALRTKSIQSIIWTHSHQSAQQNFSGPGLRALPMPVPPVELQREFIDRLNRINTQRSVADQASQYDDELFVSLQSRAFRGDL